VNYNHQIKNCDYCNDPFEASRSDAQFCSTKCRVANHRREQRREETAVAMASEWPAETLAAYQSLTTQYPLAAPTLLDLFSDEGQAAAAAAVLLAVEVVGVCEATWVKRVKLAQDAAFKYEQQCKVLEEVRRLVK
jgi:predicted nucleic acid-binding Zn ribbon protein